WFLIVFWFPVCLLVSVFLLALCFIMAIMIGSLDQGNPLYLHPNDSNCASIVSLKLTGVDNYRVWASAVKLALQIKHKMGFITGSCLRSDYVASALLLEQWDRCNAVVLNWILSSLSQDVYLGHVFSDNAAKVWEELRDTYDRVDGSIVFNLLQKINTFKQGGLPASEYYHKLNSLWREFDILTKLPDFTCATRAELVDHGKLLRSMRFLMGLDDIYQPVRSSILTREILPEAKDAFVIVSREESHKGIPASSVKTKKPQASTFVSRSNDNNRRRHNNSNGNWSNSNSNNGNKGNYDSLLCKNCGLKGHTIERCFEIIGYPPGFKRNPNLKPSESFNNNKANFSDTKGNNDVKMPTGTVSLTNDQVMKLMSLLNDKSGSTSNTHMVVIPEYTLSLLSVNKLIKDSKVNVCFDETKCYIQDLKKEKVLGTGRESAGLYLFDTDCAKSAMCLDSKFLVSYVSKDVWHNRLGHPANQVLKLLRESLNLSNIDHNGPCEGPYKVVSREGFRLPSSVLNGKSPFSLMYGREPNLSHLRSFGCLCFATVVKGSDKFSHRSEKCILIGYASGKKAYKLFSLENRNVLYSRDVKFYETVFPYKMSNNEPVNESENINFFDHFEVEIETKTSNLSPNDEEEGSSGRDGRVQQPVSDANTDQPGYGETYPATPLDENIVSEGNVGTSEEVPVFQIDLPVHTEEYANHSVLSSENYGFVSNLNKSVEPTSYEEALKDVNWVNAMNEEMNALYENKTWVMTELPQDRNPIGCKWVFKIKYKSNGEVERYKARLMAKVQKDWKIYQMDVNNAFLFGDLKEEVYMLPPPGFFKKGETKVCRLIKSLYGLKQAPRQWNQKLLEALLEAGFEQPPLPENLVLNHKENETDKYLVNVTNYQKLVGKLIYLTHTRPDISYSVHCLSQHMHAPLKSHFDIGLRVLKYLKLAPGLGVEFVKREGGCVVSAYSDSDWAKCPMTRRSVSGYCVFVNGNLVSWKSKRQATLSKSSAEAEYRSMASTTSEIMWIVKILGEFGFSNVVPADLFCDNKSAMQIAANPVMHEKTKHFDIDVHLVREKVASGLIKTVKVDTKAQVTDILTKALGTYQHSYLPRHNNVYFVENCARKDAPIRSPLGIEVGLGPGLLIEFGDEGSNSRGEIYFLKEELRACDEVIDKGDCSNEVVHKCTEILNKIHQVNNIQASEIAQKAKIKWAIEGDENVKFFHGKWLKTRLPKLGVLSFKTPFTYLGTKLGEICQGSKHGKKWWTGVISSFLMEMKLLKTEADSTFLSLRSLMALIRREQSFLVKWNKVLTPRIEGVWVSSVVALNRRSQAQVGLAFLFSEMFLMTKVIKAYLWGGRNLNKDVSVEFEPVGQRYFHEVRVTGWVLMLPINIRFELRNGGEHAVLGRQLVRRAVSSKSLFPTIDGNRSDVSLPTSGYICANQGMASYGWLTIRIQSKLKGVLEGVYYGLWWYMWNFCNKLLFDKKIPEKALIFDNLFMERSMMIALNARNKLKLINGEFEEPALKSEIRSMWEIANDMVISWILNTISEQIGNNMSFINSASTLWNELSKHYSQLDGHMIYQVTNNIINHKQSNTTIMWYYHKLKGLWDELDALKAPYACMCRCDSDNGRTNGEREQRKRLIKFLMGLDESYTNIRGQIMHMQPFPLVFKAYIVTIGLPNNHSGQTLVARKSSFKKGVYYTNCSKEGHTCEECYKIVGYPPGHQLHNKYIPHTQRNQSRIRIVNLMINKDQLLQDETPLTSVDDLGSTSQTTDPYVYSRMDQLQNQLNQILLMMQNGQKEGHDGTITTGKLFGGLYALTPSSKSSIFSFVSSVNSNYLWHSRLGHPSFQCHMDIPDKLHVSSTFKTFHYYVKTQFQTLIQTVRSDNGTEFLNESLSTFFKSQGIIHQTSCPYTPQQNARVERKHRQLLEMARSLFFQAQFPLHLWGYCILTSTYLINRLPSKVLNNKSPNECLYNKSPDLTHLRVIGCQALVYTLTTDKFTPKATLTVLIGYPPHQKGYLLYNPITQKVTLSRNVTFNETIFPFHTISPSNTTTDPTVSPLQYTSEPSPPLSTQSSPLLTHPNTPLSNPSSTSSTSTSTNSPTPGPSPSLEHNIFSPSPEHIISSPTPEHTTSSPSLNLQRTPPPPPPPTRTSTRTKQLPTALKDYKYNLPKSLFNTTTTKRHHSNYINYINLTTNSSYFINKIDTIKEPHSFAYASKDVKWIEAMNKEIQALEQNKTWILTLLPPRKTPIGNQWKEGIDYKETFAPVAKTVTIRTLLTVAVEHGWHIEQLDINNAFLHVDLHEEVYMTVPQGYNKTLPPNTICKLTKSLYGLKKENRQWFEKLTTFLIQLAFKQSYVDTSLFIIMHKGSLTTLFVTTIKNPR
ncbi:ribonuclease H-like domain-containing protein, partial [Tanacetum coccineum]